MKILGLIVMTLLGCAASHLETDFFKHDRAERRELIYQYELPEQYRLFRYGNDKVEPPMPELAVPIAKRGAAAVPFLIDQVETCKDDITVRDILLLFQTMSRLNTYDVRGNIKLMNLLKSKIMGIRDKEWRAICLEGLREIEQPKQ